MRNFGLPFVARWLLRISVRPAGRDSLSFLKLFRIRRILSDSPQNASELKTKFKFSIQVDYIFKKMIHEQLPLPVPCYDLAPLTESSLGPLARNFGYPQLAWLDGRLSSRNLELMFPPYERISRIRRALMHLLFNLIHS